MRGHDETDPATEHWEALITLLGQGRQADDGRSGDAQQGMPLPPTWYWIEADRGGGLIACRQAGEDEWRVLTNTPQFKERVGASAVQLYGQTWVRRGWVRPAKDGKSTDYQHVYGRGAEVRARVLRIPHTILERWGQEHPERAR